ncbi:MAG TPA: hypothetical protein VIY49_12785 [Bryobacteraceae bacterium]
MLNRNASLVVCVCIASLAALGQGTRYVVELSGGTQFDGFGADANSTSPAFAGTADSSPPGTVTQVIAKPDGSQFYIVGTQGVQSVTPAFSASSFTTIAGISGTPTAVALSPDGRYLYIGATGLYIVNTATNTVIPNSVPIGGAYIAGIAFSADSQHAYILTTAALGSSISQVSTASQSIVGQPLGLPNGCATNSNSTPLLVNGASIPFGGPVCSMTMSPKQLIYVSNGFAVYEINPVTMAITSNGVIETNTSTVGPLRFTPDGSTAYAVNFTPLDAGRSMVQISLGTHTFSELNFANIESTGPPAFADVLPVSATRIFAYTNSATGQPNPTTIYDVTPSPFNAYPSTSLTGVPAVSLDNVLSAVISNEQPAAAYLFLLVGNGNQTNLLKIALASNTIALQALAPLGPGTLEFVNVPPQTGVASFIQFNNGQTVSAGATSAPLAAVLVNSAGIPVYGVPVTYSAGSTGITVNNPTPTSNDLGYVQSTVTIPSGLAGGTYTITISGGGVNASFAVNVPASGTTTGPGGGPSQVSILFGNGMLIASQSGTECQSVSVPYPVSSTISPVLGYRCPLTIQVTGTNGKPLANEAVAWTIASGPGNFSYADTVTDSNGLASAVFFPQSSFFGAADFEATDVNASTPVGAVDFLETTVDTSLSPFGGVSALHVEIDPVSPAVLPATINVGEGDTIPNAIQYQIVNTGGIQQLAPIPNVGIRLSLAGDPVAPGAGSCVGSTLSNSSGLANCNLLVSCTVGLGPQRIGVNIDGTAQQDPRITLNVVAGTSRTLNLLSGNSQSGNVGQKLGQALVATVTDNCATPVSGVQVSWQVTSGSATLTNTVSVSNSSGQVSTQVMLGQIPGPVQITVSISTGTIVTFNATNNVTVGSLTLTSGGGQTAVENQAFAQPLVFTVNDTNSHPVTGVQVNFTILSGSALLSATSAVTNTAGQVSVNVTAGTSPGALTVQATYATFNASASLTVLPPGPMLNSTSFSNYASGKPGMVPCELTTATGSGLVAAANEFVPGNSLVSLNLPLPYTLAGVSISVNTVPAPIDFVSSVNGVQQVVFQTPCETAPGTATVAVTTNAGTSTAATTTVSVTVSAAQPGIFTYAGPNNTTYGYVLDTNNNAIGPSNLAKPGGTYFVVATGLGQTTPPAITNAGGNGSETIPISQVVVGVNNAGMPVVSVTYVAIGVYYVEFQLPATTCVQNNQPQPCSPTGTNLPLSLGEIVNGQTVYDGEYSYLAGVQ